MRGAFGYLKWTPETFWSATLTEYLQAIDGHNEAQGGKRKVEPPSGDEMAELLAKYGQK
jgi:hypothetical protein